MSVQSLVANPPINFPAQPVKIDVEVARPGEVKLAIPNVKNLSADAVFSVSEENDVFEYDSLFCKVARVAWLVLSMIVFPVGLVRLIGKAANQFATKKFLMPILKKNKEFFHQKRAEIMADAVFAERCQRITVETADHVKLDTLMIRNPANARKPANERKCILFFNRNDSSHDTMFPLLLKISNETGADVYTGNYRGVGLSEGFPNDINDLTMDGEAMVQCLISQGFSQNNILVHGWSFGGAVGVHVAALHQELDNEMHFCGDRTFSSMIEETKAYWRQRRPYNKNTLAGRCKAILLSGAVLFALGLIYTLRWNFKNVDCYKSLNGYKFVIFQRRDPIVPYEASLYKRVKDVDMSSFDKIRKLERRVKKIKGENIPENLQFRPYRPNFVRLDDKIDRKQAHVIGLDNTQHFDEYKAHVAAALQLFV